MERVEAESLGDVLRRTIEEAGMTDRLDERRAIALWPQVVGEHIAGLCGRPTVYRGVMTVVVRPAPLRHDLTMSRTSLLRLLNAPFGRNVISDIRFIG